jgi:hypothetical protein
MDEEWSAPLIRDITGAEIAFQTFISLEAEQFEPQRLGQSF